MVPLLQWLPSAVESKPKSSQWPTRPWSLVPWTSAPTHLLYTFHSDYKGPLLLLQQPGRLCTSSLYLLFVWLGTLFPQKSTWPIVSFLGAFLCFSAGPSLTILFKVRPPHIPHPSPSPYFSPKQFDHSLTHYIIHIFIHLLSVSPARMGAPQGQEFLNALIIAMRSTPRTVPGTWQVCKNCVEK